MHLPYAYTPQIWPPVITILVLVTLAVYSYRRRSVPGALPFTFALMLGVLWLIGISLEVAAVTASAQIFWIEYQAAWLLPSATAVTCFLLEYAKPGRWLSRRNLVLLSIPCLLNLGMILTDSLHHLAWQGFALDGEVIPLSGLGSWIFLVYAYALGLVNLVVLVWLFIRSPQQRWPAALMLAGQMAGRVVYALEAVQVIHSNLPIEVVSFWFPIPMYVIALFGFRFLNPIPLARQIVIDQMREGMLVLDRQGRIASLNPAAVAILGLPDKQASGRWIGEILPFAADLGDASTGESEISLGKGSEIRNFMRLTTLIKDWRGQEVGCLLLLHDVTVQKRAQTQLLEQERALAMLHERERLARELHDSIGQVLGYVSLQAQAIRKRAQGGDLPAVEAQLARLAEVAQAAHADVRDSILSLKAGAGRAWSFQAALRQYLDAYRDQYGIRTELSLPEGWADGIFEPEAEVQLLRVIQEVLTNARKHGKPGCVQVALTIDGNLVRLTIQDDGVGFDPSQAAGVGHYGLQFMRERVEQIGGNLRVQSTPGKGTKVIVGIPVNSER